MKQSDPVPPDVSAVHISKDRLTFNLVDGRAVSVPLAFYPTLMLASEQERGEFEICHSSVYWPRLDCDINSEHLLRGLKEARRFAKRAAERRLAKR
jgi:hypothetical protein